MDIEIITIGDEVITGHTVDTNSSFIAQQVTGIGLPVKHKSSVGDSVEAMEEVFRLAWRRAQIVITTGGLGPTDDDLTKRAIVKVFKRNLIFHEDVLEQLRERYRRRGIEMPAINQNQALLPQGARFFPNKYGSAVGICLAEEGRIFIALPGVPYEMKQIMTDEVIPYLKSLKTTQTTYVVKLRTTGIIESALAEIIAAQVKLEVGVKLAYLPSFSGVDLRIMATGADQLEATERAQQIRRQVETACGRYLYGTEDDTLEGIIGQLLKDNDKRLAIAESCTAGQLGMQITSVPGSSAWFVGGVLAYDNEVKQNLLGVNQKTLETHGAVSEECAKEMAIGARKLFNTDYALSVTGIAGPDGGSDLKPVGTVFIGLAAPHTAYAKEFRFGTSREANRGRAVYTALELLRREILDLK